MNNAFLKSFEVLQKVYSEKAFSSIALNKTLAVCRAQDKALITKIVYGVLDNDIKTTYILSKYVSKMPKGEVLIILKMGVYCLMELSLPTYAVVNDLAELAKITEDRRQVGFVNATLKNVAQNVKTFDDYPSDEISAYSVKYSYPEWALKKLIKDYGKDEAYKIVSHVADTQSTVRITKDCKIDGEQTCFKDAVRVAGKLPELDGTFTLQSLSSMAICKAVSQYVKSDFLDCCAAPGGKSVYIKQLCPQAKVVACDIHPHRVELINSYASRMGVDIETHCLDMTQPVSEFIGAFDTVLCDVPCSGFGVLDNRPDIKLFRENKDISELMKLQYQILCNCSQYVSEGGALIYSTCTVFDNENGQNIRKFLKEHPDFSYGEIVIDELPNVHGGSYQFLPHKDGMQGFFLAVLIRQNGNNIE